MTDLLKVELKDDGIDIFVRCNMCNTLITISLTNDEYADYYIRGKHIQKAMPTKSADIRELLILGVCGTCFDKLFAEE